MNWSSRNTTVISRPAAGSSIRCLRPVVRSGPAQHQPDLVGHAGRAHRLGHPPCGRRGRSRAASRRRSPARARSPSPPGAGARSSTCRRTRRRRSRGPRPRSRITVWPEAVGERLGTSAYRVVHAGAHDAELRLGAAAAQALRVVGGDQAGTEEADAQFTGHPGRGYAATRRRLRPPGCSPAA